MDKPLDEKLTNLSKAINEVRNVFGDAEAYIAELDVKRSDITVRAANAQTRFDELTAKIAKEKEDWQKQMEADISEVQAGREEVRLAKIEITKANELIAQRQSEVDVRSKELDDRLEKVNAIRAEYDTKLEALNTAVKNLKP